MRPPFYYHPRMLAYDFGPQHPLRPERLRLCMEVLLGYGIEAEDPGIAVERDALRVHDPGYLQTLRLLSDELQRVERRPGNSGELYWRLTEPGSAPAVDLSELHLGQFGFLSGDNPPFAGMWEATLAFIAGTVCAATDVRDGAQRALTLGGGLHHAAKAKASGFCLLDDPAMACSILLERFDRVAYIDIDLHHGDGVQWIWYDDPRVLTCSIHESGETLFPGTGFVEETGASYSSLNMPLAAGTTGDVWLDVFRRVVPRAIERFRPGAIVMQMGSDPHFSDPLGHLNVSVQEWLEAVRIVDRFGLPLVACGGGGYNMDSVVRMWSAAILLLSGIDFDLGFFADELPPGPAGRGAAEGEAVVKWFESEFLPNLG